VKDERDELRKVEKGLVRGCPPFPMTQTVHPPEVFSAVQVVLEVLSVKVVEVVIGVLLHIVEQLPFLQLDLVLVDEMI